MKKMIVVGGGAAGMMAAIYASEHYNVILLEQNDRLGRKLFITGKGRCNLTNDCDSDTFLKNVVSNSKFMYSAIHSFDCRDTMKVFQNMGLSVKTERGSRVFPSSDHSSDVISVLSSRMRIRNVDVRLNSKVTGICTEKLDEEPEAGKFISRVTGVMCNGEFLPADAVIIATGGMSYPLTGSTGDGYKWAKELGLGITEPEPALVPVVIKETFCKDLMGLSLKNVKVTFTALKNPEAGLKKDKVIFEDFGEMLFTHFGVSGPVILSASSYLHKYLNCRIRLRLDLKPALNEKQLDERILRDFAKYSNKQFRNALDDLLPRRLIPVVIKQTGMDPFKRVNEITHAERGLVVKTLKAFDMYVEGLRGFDEAIVTKGGISVKEIHPKTMEAKKVKGLRFAGEIIDVDALTGGFNLQIAWSTGYLAGSFHEACSDISQ